LTKAGDPVQGHAHGNQTPVAAATIDAIETEKVIEFHVVSRWPVALVLVLTGATSGAAEGACDASHTTISERNTAPHKKPRKNPFFMMFPPDRCRMDNRHTLREIIERAVMAKTTKPCQIAPDEKVSPPGEGMIHLHRAGRHDM